MRCSRQSWREAIPRPCAEVGHLVPFLFQIEYSLIFINCKISIDTQFVRVVEYSVNNREHSTSKLHITVLNYYILCGIYWDYLSLVKFAQYMNTYVLNSIIGINFKDKDSTSLLPSYGIFY